MKAIEKHYYIKNLRYTYKRSKKSNKGKILDEIVARLSINRKSAIRLMSSKAAGRPKSPIKRGRPGKYQNQEFIQSLKKVWRLSGYMCSKALKAAIPEWLPYIEQEHGSFKETERLKLLTISPATIDRILKPYKVSKGKSHTKSGGFREEIPIQENIWDIKVPGYIETDTVAHCGGSLYTEFHRGYMHKFTVFPV